MTKKNRTGKRLRLAPLILVGYVNGKWEADSICSGETEASLEDTEEPAEPESVAGFGEQGSLSHTEEADAGKSENDTRQTEERIKSYWHQLQREQKGQMRGWHQYLVIFGESWHDEHKFFSAESGGGRTSVICWIKRLMSIEQFLKR